MKLLRNQIPNDIGKRVDRDDYEFCIQSVDVTSDGNRALLLGIYEDPDFPEVFIYDARTGEVRQVDSDDALIDVPLGKAFWAPNDQDFYLNRHDGDDLYKIELDPETYAITVFEDVEETDDYIVARLRAVLDLIHDDNNYQEPVVPPNYENKHHELLVKLVGAFSSGIRAQTSFVKLFWSNYEPEAATARARDFKRQFQGHYYSMEQMKQELGVELDTSEVKAALDALEALYEPAAKSDA